MMYESPITIYQSPEYRRLLESVDALVIEECRKVGVVVNKEELVKALLYDRGQYEKGYKDALKERGIVHCKDCARYDGKGHCERDVRDVLGYGREWNEDDFCSDGIRRETDG